MLKIKFVREKESKGIKMIIDVGYYCSHEYKARHLGKLYAEGH